MVCRTKPGKYMDHRILYLYWPPCEPTSLERMLKWSLNLCPAGFYQFNPHVPTQHQPTLLTCSWHTVFITRSASFLQFHWTSANWRMASKQIWLLLLSFLLGGTGLSPRDMQIMTAAKTTLKWISKLEKNAPTSSGTLVYRYWLSGWESFS